MQIWQCVWVSGVCRIHRGGAGQAQSCISGPRGDRVETIIALLCVWLKHCFIVSYCVMSGVTRAREYKCAHEATRITVCCHWSSGDFAEAWKAQCIFFLTNCSWPASPRMPCQMSRTRCSDCYWDCSTETSTRGGEHYRVSGSMADSLARI